MIHTPSPEQCYAEAIPSLHPHHHHHHHYHHAENNIFLTCLDGSAFVFLPLLCNIICQGIIWIGST